MDVYSLAKKFQADLLKGEKTALVKMGAVFASIDARIQADLDKLEKLPWTEGTSARFTQLMAIRESLKKELQKYKAIGSILGPQVYGSTTSQATEHVQAAAKAALGDKAAAITVKGPTDAPGVNAATATSLLSTKPLQDLFSTVAADAIGELEAAFGYTMAAGTGPAELARKIRKIGQISRTRAATIARTETLRTYRETTRQIYADNADIVKGYIWVARLTTRTCSLCWSLHGSFHLTEDVFATHPNCLVGGTVVSSPAVKATTSRLYEGPVVSFKTASGFELTVTPNHPVLTPRGWVAAGLLQEGDDVVSTPRPERMIALIDPNDSNRPTVIEEVIESFSKKSGSLSVLMPTSPEYFHGDGSGGEIDVVFPDGLLRDRFDASIGKHGPELDLIPGTMEGFSLASLSSANKLALGDFTAAHRLMRGRGVSSVLGLCPAGHHQPISFNRSANFDPVFNKSSTNNDSIYAKAIRESLFGLTGDIPLADLSGREGMTLPGARNTGPGKMAIEMGLTDSEFGDYILSTFAGLVSLDRVINIVSRFHTGYVYNLETSTGYYVANNIVTHNCRCVLLPYLGGKNPVTLGATVFKNLPEAKQIAILGPGKHALYKSGVPLKYGVGFKQHPKWGPVRYQRTIAEMASKVLIPGAIGKDKLPAGTHAQAVAAAKAKIKAQEAKGRGRPKRLS